MATNSPYREQAEDLAQYYFKQLSEAERVDFFALFEATYSAHNTSYIRLKAPLKDDLILNKIDKQYVLFFILKFLPAPQQVEFICLEILDMVEKYKKQRNAYFKPAFESDFWYMCEVFLKELDNLNEYTLQWYSIDFLEKKDYKEIIDTLKYVVCLELKSSIDDFKKDTDVIRQKGKKFLNNLYYEEKYFQCEFLIHTDYQGNIQISVEMPELVGKYRVILEEYVGKTLARIEAEKAPKDIQAQVLARDLEIALQHYKSSKSLMRSVEVDIALQARGGTVKMSIQRTPLEKLVSNATKDIFYFIRVLFITAGAIFIVIPLALLFIFFVGAGILYNPLQTIVFSIPALYFAINLWHAFKAQRNKNISYPEDEDNMKGLVAEFRQIFQDTIQQKKIEKQKTFKQTDHTIQQTSFNHAMPNFFGENLQLTPSEWTEDFENTTENISTEEVLDWLLEFMWQKMQHTMRRLYKDIGTPEETLQEYEDMWHFIHNIEAKDIPQILPLPQSAVLAVLKYVSQDKIKYLFLQTTQIIDNLIDNDLDAELYTFDLDSQCTLYRFYKDGGKNKLVGLMSSYSVYKSRKGRMLKKMEKKHNLPTLKLMQGEELENWLKKQTTKYNPKNFKNEVENLTKQMKSMSYAKRTNEANVTPILYENKDILLYIF